MDILAVAGLRSYRFRKRKTYGKASSSYKKHSLSTRVPGTKKTVFKLRKGRHV